MIIQKLFRIYYCFKIHSIFIFYNSLIIAIEITAKAIDNITYQILTEEEKAKLEAEENLSLQEKPWFKDLMQKLTRTQPMEKEGEIILHHDYDGIKELDNNLPPWWVYLFYGCIAFALIY